MVCVHASVSRRACMKVSEHGVCGGLHRALGGAEREHRLHQRADPPTVTFDTIPTAPDRATRNQSRIRPRYIREAAAGLAAGQAVTIPNTVRMVALVATLTNIYRETRNCPAVHAFMRVHGAIRTEAACELVLQGRHWGKAVVARPEKLTTPKLSARSRRPYGRGGWAGGAR